MSDNERFQDWKYPEIKDAGVNPLSHYIQSGKREGRLPLPQRNPLGDVSENQLGVGGRGHGRAF